MTPLAVGNGQQWDTGLVSQARSGCQYCSMVLGVCERFNHQLSELSETHKKLIGGVDIIYILSHFRNGARYALDLHVRDWNAYIGLSVSEGAPNPFDLPLDLKLSAANSPPDINPTDEAPLPLDSNVMFEPRSIDSSIPKIEKWLQSCFHNHLSCEPPPHSALPTRVLYIGGETSKVILVEPQNQYGHYICLSYCWGPAQFYKLMTKTFKACREGIPLGILPVSFQQVIEIARRLHIDYILIDALCILQDDLRDWEIQASKMAEIYQQAYLVIALTKISSPDNDILGVPTRRTSVETTQANLIHHSYSMLRPSPSIFPLLTRAWVFQERLLAPRVLHFGPNELTWECHSTEECECGRAYSFQVNKVDFYENVIKKHESQDRKSQISEFWRLLVTHYTTLNITYKTDRLPALAGLATAMQTTRNGTYLAGLWSDSLVLDLLWRSCDEKVSKSTNAPSWSWASVEGPVVFKDFWFSDPPIVECEVMGFHCEPLGFFMTGNIKSGWVKLRSSILECSHLADGKVVLKESGRWLQEGIPSIDMQFDIPTEDEVFTLFMVRMASYNAYRLPVDTSESRAIEEGVLFIRLIDTPGSCFERIGYAHRRSRVIPLEWPEELQTITIF